jgi:hypothetical protein
VGLGHLGKALLCERHEDGETLGVGGLSPPVEIFPFLQKILTRLATEKHVLRGVIVGTDVPGMWYYVNLER